MQDRYPGPVLAALLVGTFALAVPQDADAFARLGVDGIWVPVAWQQVDAGDRDLGASSTPGSFGASVHGGLGFKAFSAGLKLNYFNEGMRVNDVENDGGGRETVRRDQFDINAHARWGIPSTKIGLSAEIGPSLSTKFDGVGYNAGAAFEYGIIDAPLVTLNAGLMGQYVNLPALINNQETDNQSFKGLLYIGADFGP